MKKILPPSILLLLWMVFLSMDVPVGDKFLPSLGRFINPFSGAARSTHSSQRDIAITGPTQGEIKILFDERDVPHIYAQNLTDAIYAQGYLHASNRLFAMDISTRGAAGRLSELIGARTIPYDQNQRQRGFERSAIAKAKNWESYEGNKEIIDAYVNGVNDYIKTLTYTSWPIEYKLLSHEPVTWSSTHTALMATNMAIMLCMSESDVPYTRARKMLSAEEFAFLYPDHNPLESPIIPSGTKWDFTAPQNSQPSNQVKLPMIPGKVEDDRIKDMNGSNNWAVSGARTVNGFPLLANDPHLSLTLPNIWYEMEIHTPEMNVHGVSIPGLPFIVIGFNENIAWGTTNSGQDVLDWYEIHWQDSTRHQYLLNGKTVDAELYVEEIEVRGQPAISDTVRYTSWGPVTADGDHKDMAMKWIGHLRAKENDISYLKKINKAKTLADYRSAVEDFQYPAQNKVFASVSGDIAITVVGVMPVRPAGEGTFVLNGSNTANNWQGYIPFAQAPHIINPAIGYVSSANQAPAAADYPYPLLGVRTFEDYRGRVINSVLDSMPKVSVEDMKALQQNNYNLQAAELLPVLLSHLQAGNCISAVENKIATQLMKWNYDQHRDSLSPVLY
nr:penicillin acylase family protein [Bacteroidota bacterium]